MESLIEIKRRGARESLINYITDYYLEQKKYYKEEFGKNYLEVMKNDRIWILETDDIFKQLCKEYYELLVEC